MATVTRFYGPTDYIELQDEHIKKLMAELAEMRQAIEDARRSAAAWKASAKMHREDELAFEQTIKGLEKDLTKVRIESLTEYTWWSEWQQARKERDDARAVARRLLRRVQQLKGQIGEAKSFEPFKSWAEEEAVGLDEGYDVEAFEAAMELKDKLP